MKKVLLLAGLAASTLAASAQNHQHEDFKFFKPKKGDFTTEAGLVGGILDSDFTLNNNSGMLRGRYFMKNNLALRVGMNLSIANEKENVYGAASALGFSSTTNTTFALHAGIEKHFKGTARLSPYIGGDILFGLNCLNEKSDANNDGVYQANYSTSLKRTDVSLGLRGVVGADYYIAPKVYLGGEVGLGLMKTWAGDATYEYNDGITSSVNTISSTGSTFNFSPTIVTGVRIGFVF